MRAIQIVAPERIALTVQDVDSRAVADGYERIIRGDCDEIQDCFLRPLVQTAQGDEHWGGVGVLSEASVDCCPEVVAGSEGVAEPMTATTPIITRTETTSAIGRVVLVVNFVGDSTRLLWL